MLFEGIEVFGWRQTEHVDIKFHPRLTILTGANSAGKTTLLNLINRHYGWSLQFVSVPKINVGGKDSGGIISFFSGLFKSNKAKVSDFNTPHGTIVGHITYSNGAKSNINIPANVGSTYNPEILNMNAVKGLHIVSHRPLYTYQQVGSIPTQVRTSSDAFHIHLSETMIKYNGGNTGRSAVYSIKETLLSIVMFGFGNEFTKPNPEAKRIFLGFQELLKVTLPPKLGFQKIFIESSEVILQTESGDFPIDAVSGGVSSIIDMVWQMYMFDSANEGQYVVSIDEPENHLHPELQQNLLPSFLKAFPRAQFIVATHNPIIIASEPNSHVYALNFNENKKVESVFLDQTDKTGTSNEILRQVLGLPFAMPLWVSEKLEEIVNEYSLKPLTKQTFEDFRNDLIKNGLEKYSVESIANLVDKIEK